jgi:threonine/homoserine/homoserine lactone efflux protein
MPVALDTWLAYAAATAVLLVIPGPTILTVISYSLTHGRRANVALVAGVALGDSTALVLSLVGLGAVLAASAMLFTAVKWAGGLYLIYLGLRMLREGAVALPAEGAPSSELESHGRVFVNTWLVTALNPKGIIFFIAFLPQFLRPGNDVAAQLWVLAVTFVVLATINAALYAVFAGSARKFLSTPRALRGFNLAGGTLLTAAGVWALFARRGGA